MTDVWYVRQGGRVYGPSTAADIETLLATGKLARTDEIGSAADGPWQPVSAVPGFATKSSPISELLHAGAGADTQSAASVPPQAAAAGLDRDQRERYAEVVNNGAPLVKAAWFVATVVTVAVAIGVASLIGSSSGWLVALRFVVAGVIGLVGVGVYVSWKDSRKAAILGSYSDARLAEEYRERRQKKLLWRAAQVAIGVIVVAVLAFNPAARQGLGRFVRTASSSADCEVVSHRGSADVFLVNGESDYGYTLTASVKNNGKAGNITATAVLSTSEGKWTRKQELSLGENELLDLTFGFPEPTINVSNIQYQISCLP